MVFVLPKVTQFMNDSLLKKIMKQVLDGYGLSKVLNEQTGKAFKKNWHRYLCIKIVILLNHMNIIDLKSFVNPSVRLRNLFNYIDARDLAQAIELCIKKDELVMKF